MGELGVGVGGEGLGIYGMTGVPCSIGPGLTDVFELGTGSMGW